MNTSTMNTSQAKHTPGPWFPAQYGEPATHWVVRRGEAKIATVIEVDTSPDWEGAANARLIAAAPDGLAFAESFMAWVAHLRAVGRSMPGMEARVREASEFIAKAKGISA